MTIQHIYCTVASSHQDKEGEYENLAQARQVNNYKQHILVRKRWADRELGFFPWFQHACRLGVVQPNAPFRHPTNWSSWTFLSLYFLCSCSTEIFALSLLTVNCSKSFLHSHLSNQKQKHHLPLALCGRTRFLTSSFPKSFSTTRCASVLFFDDNCLICLYIYLFIYLFIHSISNEPFNYVTNGVHVF